MKIKQRNKYALLFILTSLVANDGDVDRIAFEHLLLQKRAVEAVEQWNSEDSIFYAIIIL